MSHLSCSESSLHTLRKTNAKSRLIQQREASLSFLRAALSRAGAVRFMRNNVDPAVLHALCRNSREDLRYMPQQGHT